MTAENILPLQKECKYMIWMRHGNLLMQKLQSLEGYELERFAFQQ
jgi:hypothetical protein